MFHQSYGVHIIPLMPLILLIASGANTHMHTEIHTETIVRNQASAGLQLGHSWFNNQQQPTLGYQQTSIDYQIQVGQQ